MKLLSVNVSLPKNFSYQGKTFSTSIFKEPIGGRAMLRVTNLEGDAQADLTVHGGIHKAAYVYSFTHYAYWQHELGRTGFTFGQFGENFTVEGMLEDEVHIGDVFRVGGALVEVSQPRVPCFKLAFKMQSPGFQKMFLSSGRLGFYLRVLEAGEVGAGDIFERIKIGQGKVSLKDLWRWTYIEKGQLQRMKQALQLEALAPGWRQSLEQELVKSGVSQRNLLETEVGDDQIYKQGS